MRFRKSLAKFTSSSSSSPTSSIGMDSPKRKSSIGSTHSAELTARIGSQQRHLGDGSDGSVHAFRRASDGALFAVKQYRSRRASESKASYQAVLTAEYAICHDLHHGNIIKIHELISENGAWYQVMECAPFDLFAAVMQGGMSISEAECCFRQVLEGVLFLHSNGIAHRDLKLDNVVVTREGIMKIIDFGSAIRFICEDTGKIASAQGIAGSPAYLAPEVFTNRPYDPRAADIWSLAVIYYALIVRRLPWKVARINDFSFARFVGAVVETPRPSTRPLATPQGPEKTTLTSNGSSQMASTGTAESLKPTTETPPKTGASVLSLLPPPSRPLMWRMFAPDPVKRATGGDICSDTWLKGIRFCSEDAVTGQVTRCAGEDEHGREGHIHTLVRAKE